MAVALLATLALMLVGSAAWLLLASPSERELARGGAMLIGGMLVLLGLAVAILLAAP